MESKTYLKNLRVSPKKLRFFLPAIKKMSPSMVLDYLYYTPNKTARILYKAIKSAITNAKNTLKADEDLLEWKLLTIEQGQILKRFKPGGRGTAKPIKKRFSHIKIIIKAKEQPIVESSKVKSKK
jgi:large subunit ribosomal protein L22